jgi:dihydrofolate reductase
MRKLTAALFVTLDGVVESPERWPAAHFDVGVHEVLARAVAQSDAILLGRRTYQELAKDWPGKNDGLPFARYLDETSKFVVSSTLEVLDWANSSVVSGEKRLFEDLTFGTALRLVDSHTFDTGVVSLTFEPRVLAVAA